MSIISVIITGLIVWFICANAVPDEYPMITENGFLIGSFTSLALWIYSVM